jgi:hypothetical protein
MAEHFSNLVSCASELFGLKLLITRLAFLVCYPVHNETQLHRKGTALHDELFVKPHSFHRRALLFCPFTAKAPTVTKSESSSEVPA